MNFKKRLENGLENAFGMGKSLLYKSNLLIFILNNNINRKNVHFKMKVFVMNIFYLVLSNFFR